MAKRKPSDDEFEPDDFSESEDASWDSDGDDADAEDQARFSSETAFCPECGAEIYDAADICPKCFAWVDGDTSRHGPRGRRAATWRTQLVVWMLIAALAIGAGVLSFLQFFS